MSQLDKPTIHLTKLAAWPNMMIFVKNREVKTHRRLLTNFDELNPTKKMIFVSADETIKEGLHFIRQTPPTGPGDAVLQAKAAELSLGHNIGDDLMVISLMTKLFH